MAYIHDRKFTKKETYSTNLTVELSEHDENDLLVICVEFDNNGSLSADSGTWTEQAEQLIGTGGSKGVMAVYYKVAGASETNPSFTFSGTARDSMALCYTIKGAPTSSPIDGSASTTNDALSHDTSTFTTTNNDCLVLEFVCNRIALTAYVNALPGVNLDAIDNNGLHLTMQCGWWYQLTAGTTTSHEYFQVAAQAMTGSICIAIKDDGGMKGAVDGVSECATIIHPMVGNAVQYATGSEGVTDPTTFIPQFGEKRTITNATQANPVVITYTGTAFKEGDDVWIENVGGMTEINDQEFTLANVTATTAELSGEDGTAHTAYTSGGTAAKATIYLSTTGNAREINGLFGKTSFGFNVTSTTYYDRPIIAQRRLATAQNLSSSICGLSMFGDSRMPEKGLPGKGFGLGSGDNSGQNTGAKIWTFENIDSTVRSNEGISVFAFDVTQGEAQEYGTLDLTDIKRVLIEQEVIQSSLDGWGFFYKYNTIKMVSGSSGFPCTFAEASNHVATGALRTVRNQGGAAVGQYFAIQNFQIGDGTNAVYWDSNNQSFEMPSSYSAADGAIALNLPQGALTFSVYANASSTVKLRNTTINLGDFHNFLINASTSTSATYDFSGLTVINGDVVLNDVGSALSGITFTSCKEITQNACDLSGGCTINACTEATAITVTTQANLNDLANCTFSNNTGAITVNLTGSAELSINNATFTSNTTDIIFNGGADNVTGATQANPVVITATGHRFSNTEKVRLSGLGGMIELNDRTFTVANATANTFELSGEDGTAHTAYTSGGTAGAVLSLTKSGTSNPSTTSNPNGGYTDLLGDTTEITINSSESGSLIQIFSTGTQTIIDSTTGSSLVFTYTGTPTYDIVVQKAGFLPQRLTGEVMPGTDITYTINLVTDYVYDASHGLTYTTDASWASNQLTVPTFGPSGRAVYSLMIDSFISETALRNTAFNLQANGPNAIFFINDAEGATDASIENMTAAGFRYITTVGATAAEWVGVESIGTIPSGATGEYQQQDGSGTTDARTTGSFDEVIKVYGDSTHGNFDYRSHLVLKFQVNEYYQSRVDVLATYGVSTLEPTHYVVAMQPVANGLASGDPAISITIVDHTASPLVVGGKSFDYEIQDGGTNDEVAIEREINYNLSLDATYQGKDPFNWPDMVSGTETEYGRVEGQDTTTTYHGFYVSRSSADHPSYTRFQSNDGTYYVPASVASISAPNLSGGRVQIVNETGRTASAWAATTAYALTNKVLRSTGAGTESGIGLFFQCTTAGTTGGSEPTWDTTPGNTTVDGTVTWTCRAIEFDNTTVTSGYSNSWTDGEDFDSGDTIRLRWADEDDEPISGLGVATTDGTTSFLDTLTDDDVYNSYGIDGSTVTEYAADFPNVEIDVTDPDNVFYIDRLYAWYKYTLTTADGIRNFWGAITATDTSNITINNDTVDIYFDNTKSVSARQGDQIVISRADGAYPQTEPTSGGGGLGFYYAGIGYSTSSGSGLDTTERNKLLGLRDYDPENDVLEGTTTYQDAQKLTLAEAAGKVSVSGSTVTFRDQADTKDRITATVDSNGQRTSITTDVT